MHIIQKIIFQKNGDIVKCIRCGYCCKYLSVIIVDNPKKGIIEYNVIFHEGNGKECKHLKKLKNNTYKCMIHHYKWYKKTPCYKHTQICIYVLKILCTHVCMYLCMRFKRIVHMRIFACLHTCELHTVQAHGSFPRNQTPLAI